MSAMINPPLELGACHFFLRRHYPDQVSGYYLSSCHVEYIETLRSTPEIQSVNKNYEKRR